LRPLIWIEPSTWSIIVGIVVVLVTALDIMVMVLVTPIDIMVVRVGVPTERICWGRTGSEAEISTAVPKII